MKSSEHDKSFNIKSRLVINFLLVTFRFLNTKLKPRNGIFEQIFIVRTSCRLHRALLLKILYFMCNHGDDKMRNNSASLNIFFIESRIFNILLKYLIKALHLVFRPLLQTGTFSIDGRT